MMFLQSIATKYHHHVIFCLTTHPCLNTGIIMCHISPDQWLAPLDGAILECSLMNVFVLQEPLGSVFIKEGLYDLSLNKCTIVAIALALALKCQKVLGFLRRKDYLQQQGRALLSAAASTLLPPVPSVRRVMAPPGATETVPGQVDCVNPKVWNLYIIHMLFNFY